MGGHWQGAYHPADDPKLLDPWASGKREHQAHFLGLDSDRHPVPRIVDVALHVPLVQVADPSGKIKAKVPQTWVLDPAEPTWNPAGNGENDITGTITTNAAGVARFEVPLHAAFALTTVPVG